MTTEFRRRSRRGSSIRRVRQNVNQFLEEALFFRFQTNQVSKRLLTQNLPRSLAVHPGILVLRIYVQSTCFLIMLIV